MARARTEYVFRSWLAAICDRSLALAGLPGDARAALVSRRKTLR
jgi:hypothetical protein